MGYKSDQTEKLEYLKKQHLSNVFIVTNVYTSGDGKVILAIQNDKDKKCRLRGEEGNFQLITHENNRTAT